MTRDGATTFGLSFNRPLRLLMSPLLAGPRRCAIVVDDEWLRVKMGVGGWAFRATVPRRGITRVEPRSGPVWSWGAHGWRGRWLVNGSSRGLVTVRIEPPARAWCLGVPVKLRELTLSLDDPDGFVAALRS